MTPLDALKSGIKTAMAVFLTSLFLAATGLINEANDYFANGDPIDFSFARATLVAAALALAAGVGNAVLRFVQVVRTPVIAWLLNKLMGAVPAYPEANTPKVVDPPTTATAPIH